MPRVDETPPVAIALVGAEVWLRVLVGFASSILYDSPPGMPFAVISVVKLDGIDAVPSTLVPEVK